ncbi:MAG: capsule assembly Wzi family protein [Tannerellaceae bacterium]|nr:capsule assembly Wzi family protein [Tannerellaceae bacterium]
MKFLSFLLLIVASTFIVTAQSKETLNTTYYNAEIFGSAATGDYTPFWMINNRYGIIPQEAGNGYLNLGVYHNQIINKDFRWAAGINVIGAVPRDRNIYIQQLFAEIGYKSMLLTIGSKEQYHSLWNKRLSSGDMVQSINSRPIPEINLSMPEFTIIPLTKGWLQVKGNFAVGRSFDNNYLKKAGPENQYYVEDVLWHHKSIFLKIEDSKNNFPFYLTLGMRHIAQWGGISTNPAIGKQPHSLKDFARIIVAKSGGVGAIASDSINALGNHGGSYDFRLSYKHTLGNIHTYYQHYFSDKSGMEFQNGTDGLWGIEVDLHYTKWIKNIVIEYFKTTDQSGPFHYIWFDHDTWSGRGGGADNYYNNGEYPTGFSYFNRNIGSPLIPGPEYNEDGSFGFKNNRISTWHFSFEGEISPNVSYRLLFTNMKGWGTHYRPFLKTTHGTSTLLDILYKHPNLKEWLFTASAGLDTGTIVGESFGFSLGIRKQGILKNWH